MMKTKSDEDLERQLKCIGECIEALTDLASKLVDLPIHSVKYQRPDKRNLIEVISGIKSKLSSLIDFKKSKE